MAFERLLFYILYKWAFESLGSYSGAQQWQLAEPGIELMTFQSEGQQRNH